MSPQESIAVNTSASQPPDEAGDCSLSKPFDRELLRRRRDRHAARFSDFEFLLQRVGEDFRDRLQIVQRQFPKVLNLGAHHGLVSRIIAPLENVGVIVDADSSAAALSQCSGERVQCDEEALPFGEGDFDLAVSGLALHLVNDLPGTLVQMRRSLKPDGLVLAAVLGAESLRELREAWLVAEEELTGGVSPRVAPLIDVRTLGSLAQRAGLALPVADTDEVTVTYASPLALMAELRAMGMSNMLAGRRRVPVTRELLMRACEVYIERFASDDGRIPATFEIVTLTAWVPDESQPKPLRPGSAQVSLTDVLGKQRKS